MRCSWANEAYLPSYAPNATPIGHGGKQACRVFGPIAPAASALAPPGTASPKRDIRMRPMAMGHPPAPAGCIPRLRAGTPPRHYHVTAPPMCRCRKHTASILLIILAPVSKTCTYDGLFHDELLAQFRRHGVNNFHRGHHIIGRIPALQQAGSE